MRILIVAATDKELGFLRRHFDLPHELDRNLHSYKYGKHTVDLLVTGIGGVATTYFLTKAFSLVNYDIAFNIGIAGSFDHFLEIGFVVNVIEERFADLGIEDREKFYTLGEKELQDDNQFPFRNGSLHNNTPFTFSEIEKMIGVRGITVNTVLGNQTSIDKVRIKFKPEVETMEGAAFFYSCLQENVPFYQIRAISNYIEIRNIDNWNIPRAIENLRVTMVNILEEINRI